MGGMEPSRRPALAGLLVAVAVGVWEDWLADGERIPRDFCFLEGLGALFEGALGRGEETLAGGGGRIPEAAADGGLCSAPGGVGSGGADGTGPLGIVCLWSIHSC